MRGDLMRQKNNKLTKLADTQRPSSAYLTAGGLVIHDILESIRKSDEISLDRARKAGSMGKGTALGDEFSPDFDVVCFVNGHEPPFSKELIQAFLRTVKNAGRTTAWTILRTDFTQHSVEVIVEVGPFKFKLDVLPAANFVQGDHLLTAQEREATQSKEGSKRMKTRCKNQRERSNFSTSLAEATVSFVKGVPLNISRVIRIAKYWDKHVDLGLERDDVRLSGRSYLIELVAMGSNRKKTNRGLQGRFSRFLRQMQTLSSARIIFTENYPVSKIPENIFAQSPLILDPINPYNNLGYQLAKPEMVNVLQRWRTAAERTLDFIQARNVDVESWFQNL